jgi:undecaprenyl-diphosphatase
MAAATGLELVKNHAALAGHIEPLAVGFIVSFVTAIAAIKSFLEFIKKRDFTAFGWYRVVLAIAFFLVFVR